MSLSSYILSLGASINVKHPRWPPTSQVSASTSTHRGIHPEGNSLWHTQPPASAIAVLVAPRLGGKKRQTWPHGHLAECGTGSGCFPSPVWVPTICDIPFARDDSTASYHHAWSLYTLMIHLHRVPSNIVQRLRRAWDQHRPTYHWQITNARTTTTVHSWGRENAKHLMLYPTSAL